MPAGAVAAGWRGRLLRHRLDRRRRRSRGHTGRPGPAGRRRPVPRQAGRDPCAGRRRAAAAARCRSSARSCRGPARPPRVPGLAAASVGLAEVVEEVVELLDHAPASRAPVSGWPSSARRVLRLVDAASWWVSDAPRGSNLLTALRHGTYRAPREPGADRERYFTPGESASTSRTTPRACAPSAADGSARRVDDESADPGERAMLVEGGYLGVVGAGGAGQGRDWLLEIFLDADSPPRAGPRAGAARTRGAGPVRRPLTVSRSAASSQVDARNRLTGSPVDEDSRPPAALG